MFFKRFLNIFKYLVISISILMFIILNTPFITFFFRNPDQGAQLAKGMGILNGIHPFINIKGNIYGPLVFYMSALGQLLSNNRLIGEVIIIVFAYFLSYLLLYYLMEKVSKSFIISFTLLIISLSFFTRFYVYYIVLTPILVLFFIYYLIFKRSDFKGIFLLGLFCGITALFRFDVGVYAFVISFVTITIFFKENGIKVLKRNVLFFLSTLFLSISPFLFFLIVNNKFPISLIETIEIIIGMAHSLSLPDPVFDLHQSFFSIYNNISFIFWFFRIFPFLVLIVLYVLWKKIEDKERLFVLVGSIFSILIFIQALHRTDKDHILEVIVLQFVLLAWIFGLFRNEIVKGNLSIKIPIILIASLLLFTWASFIVSYNIIRNMRRSFKNEFANYKTFFYTNEFMRKKFKNNKHIGIIDLVNKNTKKNESVFFMPLSPQYYYFSQRVFKTSLGVLGPGRLTTREKQKKFFRELINSKTNVIIDFPDFKYDKNIKRSTRYYYPHLMKLIYSNYKIIKKLGDRILLCRDGRFDKFLINGSHSFNKMLFENTIFKSKNILVNLYKTNTIPTELTKRITTIKNGILFCNINIQNENCKKRKYFLGLRKGRKLYFTNLRSRNYVKAKDFFEYEVFSSTSSVPVGSYKLIVFYSSGENKWYYQEMPTKIMIKNH